MDEFEFAFDEAVMEVAVMEVDSQSHQPAPTAVLGGLPEELKRQSERGLSSVYFVKDYLCLDCVARKQTKGIADVCESCFLTKISFTR